MGKEICLIVDSSGGIPEGIMEKYGIIEVPFYFKFEDTDYSKENIDYDPNFFFKKMEKDPKDIPKTAAPNPHDWITAFKKAYGKGCRKLIVTTISSKLSTSYQTAMSAKQLFEEEEDDVNIKVIDSKTCATGQAVFEIWIGKMIKAGVEYDEILNRIEKRIPDVNTVFVVESLKYMNEGGRIGGAATFLSKIINIKPISEFIDGEVHVIKPIIGRKKSLESIVDIVASRIKDKGKALLIVQHARSKSDADFLHDYLREETGGRVKIYRSELGITVGAHSGPGTVGIGLLEYEDDIPL